MSLNGAVGTDDAFFKNSLGCDPGIGADQQRGMKLGLRINCVGFLFPDPILLLIIGELQPYLSG